MNRELFENQWGQIRTILKDRWGNLTDEDIRLINGRYDQLIAKIQQRYGISREAAEEELRNWSIDRSRTFANERSYASSSRTREEDTSRRSGDSSALKWLLAAGIPLILLAGWAMHESSKNQDTFTTTRPTSQETFITETPDDRAISENVRQALFDDRTLTAEAKNIRIQTSRGVVTISGFVPTNRDRDTIVRIVENASGARQVNNQLKVK